MTLPPYDRGRRGAPEYSLKGRSELFTIFCRPDLFEPHHFEVVFMECKTRN
jgi:hypothetical protein